MASEVFRSDFANGVTGDIAYRLNEAHTLRAGLLLRTDKTQVTNTNTLEPLDAAGNPIDAPFTVVDPSSLLGYTAGLYLQDEWRLTNSLTLNAGIRFDQYWAYITEYQFSPRFSLTWKPFESTTFHAGYARTFTPPEQVLAAPTNLALVQNTTQQPSVNLDSPVRAERADVYDVGVVQQVLPGLEAGIDAYYKHATNLIDDGQFGAGLSCSPRSIMPKARMSASSFLPNTRTARSRPTAISRWRGRSRPIRSRTNSCSTMRRRFPTLGGLTEFQYLQTHWVYTDHSQWVTASAGGDLSVLRPTGASGRVDVGIGRRRVRHQVFGRHDLRQRLARRRRQYQHGAAIHPVQRRHRARIPMAARSEADDGALRRRSICSTRSTSSATAAASACSRRNTARGAAISLACRRNFRNPQQMPDDQMV